jgi:hypothetical protein
MLGAPKYTVNKDPRLRHWVHSTATWPLSGTHRCLPLRRHLAGTRADPDATLLRVLVLLDPGARGRLLLGPSPALIIVSVSTPPLRFFSRKVLHLSMRKEERSNIWDGGGSSQCRRGLANPGRFVVCMKNWCNEEKTR